MSHPDSDERSAHQEEIGSEIWAAVPSAEFQLSRGAYLERVAATPYLREIAQQSLEAMDITPGDRVLEVGCGTGVFLPALAEMVSPGGRVVGVDHAPDFVDAARTRIADLGLEGCVEVVEGNAFRLPFPGGSFDAAHCERVLMHLDAPVTALREMRRVTRAGRPVVAAETHWAGLQIDHPDREALDSMYQRWLLHIRNPAMGLELRRRMVEAGLTDVHVKALITGAEDADILTGYGLDLAETANTLVAEGCLSRERADAAIAWFDTSSRDGTYFAYGGMMVTRGTA